MGTIYKLNLKFFRPILNVRKYKENIIRAYIYKGII